MRSLNTKYSRHAEVLKFDNVNINRNIECMHFLITDRPDFTTMNCLLTYNYTTASIIDITRKIIKFWGRFDSVVIPR